MKSNNIFETSEDKLTKEDISDIRAARAAKREYLATGKSYTVDELREEIAKTEKLLKQLKKPRL
jgi:hypothetical protein